MADFDESTRVRLAEVQLGLNVEEFLQSKIGRYLIGRADIDRQRGIEVFAAADIDDKVKMREAQFLVNMPNNFLKWLEDAVIGGRNAEEQLQQQETQQED